MNDIVDTRTGRTIGRDGLISRLSDARVIYVGEMHTSVEDHRVQLDVLRELHNLNPPVVLGVEMLPRESQVVVDRYVRGELDEEDFLREVKWQTAWGYPFELYRDIFRYARKEGIRIVALNAPGAVVKQVAREGLVGLSPENRARLAETFHLDDEKHRGVVRQEFTGHLKEMIKDFDTFFEAQLAWEETMAETLAGVLKAEPATTRVMVLVGKGHIRGETGLPELTSLRVTAPALTIAPLPIDYEGSVVDPDIAEIVWITGIGEKMPRGKLGVMIRPVAEGKGLEVMGVAQASPAAKAGVRKGDFLLELDGTPLGDAADIRTIIERGDGKYRLMLLREGRRISVDIFVEPPNGEKGRAPE